MHAIGELKNQVDLQILSINLLSYSFKFSVKESYFQHMNIILKIYWREYENSNVTSIGLGLVVAELHVAMEPFLSLFLGN